MAYQVTKTYGHDLGLSATFRQWRAQSHCRFLHGYALSFKFTFQAEELDENGWAIDFGSLKPLKQWLTDNFDHKLVLAEDDPAINDLMALSDADFGGQVADVVVLHRVGCEAFAKEAYHFASMMLFENPNWRDRVRLVSVEVREHGANSAIYINPTMSV